MSSCKQVDGYIERIFSEGSGAIFTNEFDFLAFLYLSHCLKKGCNTNAMVLRKLSQESCGLPEWFLSGICFLNYMFFPKGKIRFHSEYNKNLIAWAMKLSALWFPIPWRCCLWSVLLRVALARLLVPPYAAVGQGVGPAHKTSRVSILLKKLLEPELSMLYIRCFPQMWPTLEWYFLTLLRRWSTVIIAAL